MRNPTEKRANRAEIPHSAPAIHDHELKSKAEARGEKARVQLKVVEAPEGLRGDTASNVTKPAILETGKTVNVPLFIQEGETVKIDTRTGAYMGRA